MAEEAIDKAIKTGFLEKRKCKTSHLRLTNSDERSYSSRLHIYGEGKAEIEAIINEKPESGIPVNSKLPYTPAEIIWICRNEMPVTIEDILARRTRALFLDARASLDMATVVADLMVDEFGYGDEWKNEQIKSYGKLVQNYI
jgi:glycerol-3-phosphate dehydrogenase